MGCRSKGKPKNVRGLIFPENEAGYLVGVAAATVAKANTVSFVGGQSVPAVVAFRAGLHPARRRRSKDQGALGLLGGVRRPGEVQGAGADQI